MNMSYGNSGCTVVQEVCATVCKLDLTHMVGHVWSCTVCKQLLVALVALAGRGLHVSGHPTTQAVAECVKGVLTPHSRTSHVVRHQVSMQHLTGQHTETPAISTSLDQTADMMRHHSIEALRPSTRGNALICLHMCRHCRLEAKQDMLHACSWVILTRVQFGTTFSACMLRKHCGSQYLLQCFFEQYATAISPTFHCDRQSYGKIRYHAVHAQNTHTVLHMLL